MAQPEKGKNIFQAAMDAVSNRDEKAAIEAAMKRGEELEKRIEQMQQSAAQNAAKLAEAQKKLADSEKKVTELTAQLEKAQAELTSTRSDLAMSKNAVQTMQQRVNAINAELQKQLSEEKAKQVSAAAAAAAEAAEKAQTIAEHTLKPDESLSHLALKYYGSAYEPYWRVIYEANKAVIGDNPGRVRPGTVLKIPVLPDELKKK